MAGGFTIGINNTDPPPDGGGGWYRSANYLLSDDVNWVHGAHQIGIGWNSLVSPSFWGMDMAISRVFRITERQALEIRADAFNVANSFIFSMTTTANAGTGAGTQFGAAPTGPSFALINNAQFGQILAAQPTRKIQFALKYSF